MPSLACKSVWAYPEAEPRWRALAASQGVPRGVIRAFARWYTRHQGRHDRIDEKLKFAQEPSFAVRASRLKDLIE